MDAIREQYHQLRQAWETTYTTLAPNPTAYQPHLMGASLEQLNEAVRALGHWLDRARAPKGFAPTFHLSRSLAATSLAAATTAAQALSRGELGHFPAFVAGINQSIAALHTVLLFSDPGTARELNAELSARLSEALSLLETAQRELAGKASALDSATTQLAALREVASKIEEWSTAAEQGATLADQHSNQAAEALAEAQESTKSLNELKASAEGLLDEAKDASDLLAKRHAELGSLMGKASEQAQVIAELLPKGASAGLASAFAGRVNQLERTKWLWMVVFVLSMLGLFVLALRIIDLQPSSPYAVWQALLQRLPLAAPMVWLGWFSAVQYGNTLRVQEDYAFKEATSKAFAGYRDHMEYLANVNLEEGNSAMTRMAQRTIDILAHEPLRIFQGIDKDAAPSHGLLGGLRRDKSAVDAKAPSK